jgi:hypothetical protein
MLLKQAKPGTGKSAPAGLPRPIAAAAARVEAEATPVLRAAVPAPAASPHAARRPATAHADNRHQRRGHRLLPTKPAAGKKP